MLLPDPPDGLGPPQSPRRLTTSFGVVVVVIFEGSDLILELLADFHGRAVPLDFRGEGDICDVREGVVDHPRLSIVSTQVLQVVEGVLSCLPRPIVPNTSGLSLMMTHTYLAGVRRPSCRMMMGTYVVPRFTT